MVITGSGRSSLWKPGRWTNGSAPAGWRSFPAEEGLGAQAAITTAIATLAVRRRAWASSQLLPDQTPGLGSADGSGVSHELDLLIPGCWYVHAGVVKKLEVIRGVDCATGV